MSNERDYYKRQSVLLSEEAKKSINITSSVILTTEDDCELGKVVRDLMTKKIKECDEHIKHMTNL